MKKRVTIKDIASKLNISPTAVSRALNDHSDISESLKKRVQETARDMGYTRNVIAKRLVTNNSNTIGCFMLGRQDIQEETFGFHLIGGIIDEANRNNYDILLFTTSSSTEQGKDYIEMCLERRVEGAIFMGLRLDDPYLDNISQAPFPTVIFDTELPGTNVYCVTSDNRTGIRRAMEYLWNLGHERIAFIAGHAQAQVTKIRFDAYREFMEGKHAFLEGLIFSGDYTRQSGYRAAQEILVSKLKPSAVLVSSDLMALGAIQAFKDAGLHVPSEMSIIGIDNILACEYIEPQLTTIAQNPFKMGEQAVKTIISCLEHRKQPRRLALEMELIVRGSCGPNPYSHTQRTLALP
ncbi:MAG: LacI family transcriptional regulator [Firmicutes bacterium]|nr:LacI family transcriptional regulator [Bacillota bacterium]